MPTVKPLVDFWRDFDSAMSSIPARVIICITIFFLFLFAYAPGGMSFDSVRQYEQALSGTFSKHHPPIMALIWRLFLFFQQGALPMLCFHLLMLSVACLIMSELPSCNGKKQWLWLFLPLLPQVYGNAGMIWKDVGMAFAFFLAFSLYLKYKMSRSRLCLGLCLLFCFYGLMVRHNAVAAILPVIFLLFFWHNQRRKWLKSAFMTIILSALILVSFSIINSFIAPKISGSPLSFVMINEISVTSHLAGKNLFDKAHPAGNMKLDEIQRYPGHKGWDWYNNVNASRKLMINNWLNVVIHYPIEYIQAKFKLFLYCISFPLEKNGAFSYGMEDDAPEKLYKSKLRSLLEMPIKFCMDETVFGLHLLRVFFLPIFWIPLSVLSFIIGMRRNDVAGRSMALASSSGISYFLSYLATPTTTDYRFFLWTNLAIIVSLLIWFYAPSSSKRLNG